MRILKHPPEIFSLLSPALSSSGGGEGVDVVVSRCARRNRSSAILATGPD